MSQPAVATKAEFSRLMGWEKSYTTKLGQQGRLVMTADGLVDVEASRRKIEATADPGRDDVTARHAQARGSGVPAAGDNVGNSYQAARAVKERYLALEAKRAYEVACGQLMRAEEVAAAVADAATTLRTRLESLADQLAVQITPEMDEHRRRAVAADLIESILSGLSADFAKIAKEPHAPA